jgi:glycosyltransferase involved in cell wall biosynthesis
MRAAPRRILFIIRSLGIGGAERQLVLLASGLQAIGWDVTVCSTYPSGPLEPELVRSGVRVVALGKAGRWDLIGPLRRLLQLVRDVRPDVIHGYMPTSNLLSLLARRAHPAARVVWGVRASGLDWTRYDGLARRAFRVSVRLARRADLIIANSDEGARWHAEAGYPRERIVVVANGIDAERYAPDAAARARQRAAWGIAPGALLIGLVGRIDPMKDHDTFLRAAARLRDAPDDTRFVCVGDGDQALAGQLRALSEELGIAARLMWESARLEPRDVYCALDILTSASRYGEGFPNVVGEAMACGVACVVTRCGDAPHLVGETGMVVPIGDPDALVGAWRALSARDRSVLGLAARARIIAEFSVARLVQRSSEALATLVEGGRPQP